MSQASVRAVDVLLPCAQFSVRRRQRQNGVWQGSQSHHARSKEAVALRLVLGQVGIEEVGASAKKSERRDADFADGAHGLPLREKGEIGGGLEVAWDVHVGGEEEAA